MIVSAPSRHFHRVPDQGIRKGQRAMPLSDRESLRIGYSLMSCKIELTETIEFAWLPQAPCL